MQRGRKGHILLPFRTCPETHSLWIWDFRLRHFTYFCFNRGSHLYQDLDGFYQALVSQQKLLDLRGVWWLTVLQFMQHSIMGQNRTVQRCQTWTSKKKKSSWMNKCNIEVLTVCLFQRLDKGASTLIKPRDGSIFVGDSDCSQAAWDLDCPSPKEWSSSLLWAPSQQKMK